MVTKPSTEHGFTVTLSHQLSQLARAQTADVILNEIIMSVHKSRKLESIAGGDNVFQDN